MEDAHTEILALEGDKNIAFFGVYDGHGGKWWMVWKWSNY